MKVAVFSTKPYDQLFLEAKNRGFNHDLLFYEPRLTLETSVLANGAIAVCCFVNDQLDAAVLTALAQQGVRRVGSGGHHRVRRSERQPRARASPTTL